MSKNMIVTVMQGKKGEQEYIGVNTTEEESGRRRGGARIYEANNGTLKEIETFLHKGSWSSDSSLDKMRCWGIANKLDKWNCLSNEKALLLKQQFPNLYVQDEMGALRCQIVKEIGRQERREELLKQESDLTPT